MKKSKFLFCKTNQGETWWAPSQNNVSKLAYLYFRCGGHIFLKVQEQWVYRVELTAFLRVVKNFVSLLNTLEESIVVGVLIDSRKVEGV